MLASAETHRERSPHAFDSRHEAGFLIFSGSSGEVSVCDPPAPASAPHFLCALQKLGAGITTTFP